MLKKPTRVLYKVLPLDQSNHPLQSCKLTLVTLINTMKSGIPGVGNI